MRLQLYNCVPKHGVLCLTFHQRLAQRVSGVLFLPATRRRHANLRRCRPPGARAPDKPPPPKPRVPQCRRGLAARKPRAGARRASGQSPRIPAPERSAYPRAHRPAIEQTPCSMEQGVFASLASKPSTGRRRFRTAALLCYNRVNKRRRGQAREQKRRFGICEKRVWNGARLSMGVPILATPSYVTRTENGTRFSWMCQSINWA